MVDATFNVDDLDNRQGILTTIQGANPAVGAEFAMTVPAGQLWKVTFVKVGLSTSAVVANRVAILQVKDESGNILHELTANSAHTASTLWVYQWVSNLGYAIGGSAGGRVVIGIPELWLPAGYTLQSATTAKDAGDDYSIPFVQAIVYS